MAKFSKGEAIRFGWNTMKSNLGFFIPLLLVVLLVVWLIPLVPVLLSYLLAKEKPLLSSGVNLICSILGTIVELGMIKIFLNFCDNLKSKISDLFSQYRLFFRYFFASILSGLITLFGMILLIIPGIYLGIRFQFFGYFIVDKKAGVIESLKRSWRITKGNAWNLFLFGLLLGAINLLGVLCLVMGLFATIPTTEAAFAFVYRKLLAKTETV